MPTSMKRFEFVILCGLILNAVNIVVDWRVLVLSTGGNQGMAGISAVIGIVLNVALLFWISRGRSHIAKWLFVIGTIAVPFVGASPLFQRFPPHAVFGLHSWMSLLQYLLSLVGCGILLFDKAANTYIGRKPVAGA